MGKVKNGFTIVELLIVIVIVGILAAIVFVSYSGIKSKAINALLASNLSNVSKTLSIYKLENGVYPPDINTLRTQLGSSISSNVTIQEYFFNGDDFCVNAINEGVNYRLTNGGEPRLGQCSRPTKDRFSLIKWNEWIVGVGGTVNYTVYGDGSSRVIDVNPWGVQDVVWDVSDQDPDLGADGGWVSSNFSIDNTKMYRFSVFVRRKVIGNGTYYFGTNGFTDAVLKRSTGAVDGNPYFCSRTWWGNAGDWYLVTGYVWPSNSGTGASMQESGIYDMNGIKLFSNHDYVWQANTATARHRTFLYSATDITTNQQFYQPRVDVVDGTEPTLNELLKNSY